MRRAVLPPASYVVGVASRRCVGRETQRGSSQFGFFLFFRAINPIVLIFIHCLYFLWSWVINSLFQNSSTKVGDVGFFLFLEVGADL